jgi:plasmid stabilization system protein ParE
MAQIIIAASARNDLKNINNFIAKDSTYYSERFTNELIERIGILQEHPEIGKPFFYKKILFLED